MWAVAPLECGILLSFSSLTTWPVGSSSSHNTKKKKPSARDQEGTSLDKAAWARDSERVGRSHIGSSFAQVTELVLMDDRGQKAWLVSL